MKTQRRDPGQFKRNIGDTDSTDDHGRTLCADKDWMALVGDYDLGSRVAVWRWHVCTGLLAGKPELVSSQA